jgi:hypothetical protein
MPSTGTVSFIILIIFGIVFISISALLIVLLIEKIKLFKKKNSNEDKKDKL